MKILIAGSRSIRDFDLSEHIPSETELIISGGAEGIDNLAEQYADKHRISKLIRRPRYDLHGKAAPIKRNEIMVDLSDMVLIIWDGVLKGTKHTAAYAKKKKQTAYGNHEKLTVIHPPYPRTKSIVEIQSRRL